MVEGSSLSLLTTGMLGLTVGFTACTAYCLPYFGSWILGRHPPRPWVDAGWFFLGRMAAYMILGGATAALGGVLATSTHVGHLLLAFVSLFIGILLLFQKTVPSQGGCCGVQGSRLPPFLLGVAVSVVPCPPLASLLAACSLTGDPVVGLLHGGLFGLTASLAPVLLVTTVLGHVGRAVQGIFPDFSLWLRRGAGLALVTLALQPFV